MKTVTKENGIRLDSALDLYLTGNFQELVNRYRGSGSPDVKDIVALGCVELGLEIEKNGKSSYSQLLEGMEAYRGKNHKLAASSLGSWLLRNDDISSLMLRRLVHSAREAKNYGVLHTVAKKFIDREEYRPILVEPYLEASFQLREHREVLDLFEKYREHYQDINILHYVAFSMLHLERYAEAERFLLFLFKKIHGFEYEVHFDSIRSRYDSVIARIPEMEKSSNLSREDKMNLGMAYLFSSRYSEALKIFLEVSPR